MPPRPPPPPPPMPPRPPLPPGALPPPGAPPPGPPNCSSCSSVSSICLARVLKRRLRIRSVLAPSPSPPYIAGWTQSLFRVSRNEGRMIDSCTPGRASCPITSSRVAAPTSPLTCSRKLTWPGIRSTCWRLLHTPSTSSSRSTTTSMMSTRPLYHLSRSGSSFDGPALRYCCRMDSASNTAAAVIQVVS